MQDFEVPFIERIYDEAKSLLVEARDYMQTLAPAERATMTPLENLQSISEGLRLTTARYYTPSGVTIHEKGIEPNVEVVMSPEEDRQLRIQHVRSDVQNAVDFKERFGFEPIQDRQLDTALEVIQGLRAWESRGEKK